jgi:hypothetical protein
MFYLKQYDELKIISNIDQEIFVDITARSKYIIEEGLCSLVLPNKKIIVKWFDKIKSDKIVCTHSEDTGCVVNTAHPCVLYNTLDENIQVQIKNLNNVIETYKNS